MKRIESTPKVTENTFRMIFFFQVMNDKNTDSKTELRAFKADNDIVYNCVIVFLQYQRRVWHISKEQSCFAKKRGIKTSARQQLQSLFEWSWASHTGSTGCIFLDRWWADRHALLVHDWLWVMGLIWEECRPSQFAEADPGSADQCLDSFLLPADGAVLPLLSREHKAPSNLLLPPAPVTSTCAYYTDLDRKPAQHDCSLREK